jgi:hypothetical protein
MRSEGAQLIEAVQETIGISREAGLPVEIYTQGVGKPTGPR